MDPSRTSFTRMIYPTLLAVMVSTIAEVLAIKFPSKSVTAPSEVPLKLTVAKNGTGVPVATSVTFPETTVCCPISHVLSKKTIEKSDPLVIE